MRKLICILTLITLLLAFTACGGKNDKPAKTNEELITERINAFLTAYNSGDFEGTIACMDRKTGNEMRAMFNVLGALGGSLIGIDFEISDLFALGVSMSKDDFMKLQVSKIEIKDSTAVVTTKTALYPKDDTYIMYFTLIYENDGWYINDISDIKPNISTDSDEDGLTPEDIEESLKDIDQSFLTETKASENLVYQLSYDKTYYILTGLGDCKDSHIVIPEYPSEYNDIPLKEISCSLDKCTYVTIPKTVETIKEALGDGIVAINYLGSLNEFCNINYTPDAWYGYDANRFAGKVIYINGAPLIGNLVIPAETQSIAPYAFAGYDKISSVSISNTISIGEYAFYKASSLKNVTITGDATINKNAFGECSALTAINVSGGSHIGDSAFANCKKLSSISLGTRISHIGPSAFFNSAYTEISSNWTKGLLYIGNYLYSAKPDVINATVKDGTLGIASSVFNSHNNLTSITLPASIRWIGTSAFNYAYSLQSIKYDGYAVDWNKITIAENNNSLHEQILISSKTNLPLLTSTFEFNGHSYAVFTHIQNWNEAEAFCENLGGHLVTFSSKTENDMVFSFMKSVGLSMAHIGMSDTEEEGVWKWVTGEAMDYTNWDEGEPNGATSENYGCFWKNSTDGKWNDTDDYGDRYMGFICEWDYSVTGNSSESNVSQGLEYQLNNDQSGYIVAGLGSFTGTNLVIPSTYNNLPVVEIKSYAFQRANITGVILPQTIKKINNGAFWETLISTIHIPAMTQEISGSAFAYCRNLTSITVDQSSAYYKSIDGNLYDFRYDKKMRLHTYAPGKRDKSFEIPSGIFEVGVYAFYGCVSLESLTLGNDVEKISIYSVQLCPLLKSINIGSNVSSIDNGFLAGCGLLSTITVANGNGYYKVVDGVLYSADEKTLLCYPCASPATQYSVISGVTHIANSAFSGAKNLTSVTLPDSIVYVDSDAFTACDNLFGEAIDGVYYIGNWVIKVDHNASAIILREGTVGIASGAIHNIKVASVHIPASVKYINNGAFSSYSFDCDYITFENYSGWHGSKYYYPSDTVTVDFSNPEANVEYLTNTYEYYDFVRN